MEYENVDKIIEIKDTEINVKEIMKNIQERARIRRISNKEVLDFITINNNLTSGYDDLWNEYIANVDLINHNYIVSSYYDMKSNRRILGSSIIFIKKIIRKILFFLVEKPLQQQTIFNTYLVRSFNQQRDIMSNLSNQINEVMSKSKNKDEISKINNTLAELESTIKELKDENTLLKKEIEQNYSKYLLDTNHGKKGLVNIYNLFDYKEFTDKYRGSEQSIKEKLFIYKKYVENLNTVVDIGCGRGEFLSLLTDWGSQDSFGFELNYAFYKKALSEGLKVFYGDGVEYLDNNANLNLDGIFCSQMIEHLSLEELLTFINGASKNLRKGGMLIFETPNPKTLFVHTNSFVLDPTHQKFVHPETAKSILEANGFKVIDILFISPHDQNVAEISSTYIDNLEEFNKSIRKLNDLLYGAQDYSIIAEKL